jgi:hypothetical protein
VLRLLGTLREEIESIRTKQAEIYEVILSYKDQLRELQTTVTESLKGLPKSPYIAGQLVPAPRKKQGVDDFRDLLATYLHGPTDSADDEKPVDVDLTPIPIPDLPPVEDSAEDGDDEEEEEDEERRRRRGRGGGGGGGGPRPYDEDVRGLNRGPERDVEPFDLRPPSGEDDEEDRDREPGSGGGERPEGERGERRGRRRGRRGRRRGRGGEERDRPPQERREGRREDDDRGGRFDRHEHRDSAESSRFAAAVEAGGLSTASSGRLPVASPPPEQPQEPAEKPAPEPPPSSNPGDEPGV